MNRTIGWFVLILLAWTLGASACIPTLAAPARGKPNIMLVAPPHGSEFREGESVAAQTVANDATGIARVELWVDGALVRSDAAPSPQTYFNIVQNWKAIAGVHTLTVRAYNTAGAVSDAASVSITILPAAATPVPAPTAPPVAAPPSPVALATPPPSPPSATAPPTATCADNSELVIESFPEGAAIVAGHAFDKGWRMKNSGTCAWGQGYAFVFISGEAMTPEMTILLANSIAPGDIAEAWIVMSAPTTSGAHQGQWQMRNAQGALFGAIFKASIQVIGGAPPPAAAAPTSPFMGVLPSPTSPFMGVLPSPTSPFMGALPSPTSPFMGALPSPTSPFMGVLPSPTKPFMGILPSPTSPFMGVLPSPTTKR